MADIKIGDRVKVRGETQSYILTDPSKTHTGVVIGNAEGQLVVKLDKPVKRGTVEFQDVTVPERTASLIE